MQWLCLKGKGISLVWALKLRMSLKDSRGTNTRKGLGVDPVEARFYRSPGENSELRREREKYSHY